MAGRPSKRTPEREARLLEALRAGNTRRAACHYAAIEERTFQRWMQASVAFVAAVEKAEADCETRMVAQIAHAAQTGTWQAAAWWLERRRSDIYGRPYALPETPADAAPVHVTVIFDHANSTIDQSPTLSLNGRTSA